MSQADAKKLSARGFKLRHVFSDHSAPITWVGWSSDGLSLASCAEDQTIRLWELGTGKLLRTFHHGLGVNTLAWSPDGRKLASCISERSLQLWDSSTGQSSHLQTADDANRAPSKGRLSAVDIRPAESLQFGDPGARPPLHYTRGVPPGEDAGSTYRSRPSMPNCVVWSPDGRWLASSAGMTIRLSDASTGELVREFVGHSSRVTHLTWSSVAKRIASCSEDSTVRIWNIEGKSDATLTGHRASVRSVAWSPDGRLVASCSKDQTIRLWDVQKGAEKRVLEGHTDQVITLSFTADGRFLASKALDKTVRVWRSQTGDPVSMLVEPHGGMALAFHPQFPVLASSCGSEISVWDFELDIDAPPVTETVRYTTAKIALVGDSGVGKTGVGWRIAHGTFKDHPSSHGQQFWVVSELAETRADGTLCEAVLWDFAGQPDYRLTHALFLDDVDLALVLFDPTGRQDPLKGIEYWLKQLGLRGRQPRTILVGARSDRGSLTLTREELEDYCRSQGVTGGFVVTSALTGEGIPELLKRVRDQIRWDEMTPTITTTTFKRLKDHVLGLKQGVGTKDVLVTPAALRTTLQATQPDQQFSEGELITSVKHLANHGYVSILRKSSSEEIILLAPDLLINLASSLVLEARRNPKGLGFLDEARVLLGAYEFPEVVGLGRREAEALLDAVNELFVEHNVCFRESFADQILLVFPSLINQKRPPKEDIETVEGFSYTVTGSVETVYPALVVLLGYTNTFTRTHQWQHQAQYEMGSGEVCGFRQIQEREGQMELGLYYGIACPSETRTLFQGLFERFLRHRNVAVAKYPPVSCPECGYRQPRSEVVKRIQTKKPFLFCGDCGNSIDLSQFGEEVKLSRRHQERVEQEQALAATRTSFETALVRVKAFVRDRRRMQAPSCFVSYARGDLRRERWIIDFASDLKNAGIDAILDEWDNPAIGSSLGRFISRIEKSNFVIAVGTPVYRLKYENKVLPTGSVVAAEVDLIHLRLTGTENEKKTVLPVLLEGDSKISFPPLLQGRTYCDMRLEDYYYSSIFDLILTMYEIPFTDRAVTDLRQSIRAGSNVEAGS
jgi:WD40 repeat protein